MAMLSRTKVMGALETKREQFAQYQQALRLQSDLRNQLLARFMAMHSGVIAAQVKTSGQEWPGALPTPEFDRAEALCIPFEARWESHQEARRWALAVLEGHPVAAVDGSQIPPSKELSIPVAAVQIGWYLNYHVAGGRYEKDVRFEVLTPNELGDEESGDFPDWRVNQRRFMLECEQLVALMERFASEGIARETLCFFDGSFIISFAGQMRPGRAEGYLDAVRSLLGASKRLAVPLVGFVDSSASRDVVMLVNTVAGPPYMSLTDGVLFDPLLPAWGDRTPFFLCARNDPLSQSGAADFYKDVAFCYIRLAMDRPPARLEVPRWVVEDGCGDEIVARVLGECIVGAGGYPYAIESADAIAVLKQTDREQFYVLFQRFIEQQGLPFHLSRKSLSKQKRRVS
ncbi:MULTISPECIES: DNA double-strand break repair nuclease NurA [Caldilinea]|jgi:hypothetical protein|nr:MULTISPECIES: DNA double-strand break repair nuclease NurA [Caldilinea]GIV75507.1 MAG: hypothetical protein KatS3mg049_4063 [Caldilinea sp.]